MNRDQHRVDSLIKELSDLKGFDYLFDEIHRDLFERMMCAPTLDAHQELHYIIKSLKEVESTIQSCVNRTNSNTQDTN